MVFDRISLIEAYKVLKTVNENDGPVSKILFNKTAFYGTKTQPDLTVSQSLELL